MDLNQPGEGAAPAGGMSAIDKIAIEATGLEQAAAAAEEAILNPPDENALDPAEAWGQLPYMLGGILSIAMPELRNVYTPQACHAWGASMALVADKYGWDASKVIGPELALVAASVPLVVPTIFAIKRHREEAAKKEPPPSDKIVANLNTNPMAMEPGGFVDPQ